MNNREFYDRALATFQPPEPVTIDPDEALFLNRELSWLSFNERVLREANHPDNPLMERANFLSITESNIDEFYAVRIGTLHESIRQGSRKKEPSGLQPKEEMEVLLDAIRRFQKLQYASLECFEEDLKARGIQRISYEELAPEERVKFEQFFLDEIFPVLTPMAVDQSRPFPLVQPEHLYLFIELLRDETGSKDEEPYALLQIPDILPRLLRVPGPKGRFILLEEVVRHNLGELFKQHTIESVFVFRVHRNADFSIDEDDTYDLLMEIEDKIRQRQRGSVILLTIEDKASKEQIQHLKDIFGLKKNQIMIVPGPLDIKYVGRYRKFVTDSKFYYPDFEGQPSPDFIEARDYRDMLEVIRDRDVLLYHPYESFDPVIKLIQGAAKDPKVLAIKQTLYRVSGDSPIVKALEEAAHAGKQVFVLLELKARFDEERNIQWARRLEQSGCHVIYGLKGLKTHSKITLIVRQEEGGIRRYCHLGTGNYNDQTAKIYTDYGMLTAKDSYGEDASNFFNMLSGYTIPRAWSKLVPAPRFLREDTIAKIQRETENAKDGKPAMIVAKFNSLLDEGVIAELYKASKAGVVIRLIVRGISTLRPGIKGVSENIEIRSLIGRFLEHPRVFFYYNNGDSELYLSSADWMPRNLNRRIELLFPVDDEPLKERIYQHLIWQLEDTERATIEDAYGQYHDPKPGPGGKVDSMIELMRDAKARARQARPDVAELASYEVRRKAREE